MRYDGKYIDGEGDVSKLKLVDDSFDMLHSSPTLPNLKMLYKSLDDMFCEGFMWGNKWWMQNSYGFSMGVVPFLDPLWLEILQHSFDAFWTRMGDGKRMGIDCGEPTNPLYALVAPDGALGDCAGRDKFGNGCIAYRQGDLGYKSYDWFYEATAAGVHVQATILLFDRRPEMLEKYIPYMWRSINHVESVRADNGLFLVGAAANLLAPSYGGSFNEETGEIGKGYLTGLSVTYAAALKKFIELLKMTGDTEGVKECQRRLDRTIESLSLLLTDEGYLVKSMDPDGTKHGIYGALKYGYFESVCNVDAIAWNVVDDTVAESIYSKIESINQLRQTGAISNNYPHLDDTLPNYRKRTHAPDAFGVGLQSGEWVDGGCWGTVEGRAILAYMRLGKSPDAFRSSEWYMRWAEEYRQDAPLTQWGWNNCNRWQCENRDHTVCNHPVSVMIDNFAPVTCLLNGLFAYGADAQCLIIRPQIPNDIDVINQKSPIFINGCKVYITYKGGTDNIKAFLNGTALDVTDDNIRISCDMLARGGEVHLHIDRSGEYELSECQKYSAELTGDINGLPDELVAIYQECRNKLESATNPNERSLLMEICLSAEAAAIRRRLPFDKCALRPMTDERKNGIINTYDATVKELYNGLRHRSYAVKKIF